MSSADEYMIKMMKNVNHRYKPDYHADAPAGWMNDPNGLIYAFGKYHLFFQYNPFDVNWGAMHWGHYTSSDLIRWELMPAALLPDKPYDKDLGCFSGTALEEGGKLYLMYTGTMKGADGELRQQQCFAVSENGIDFIKTEENPVIRTEEIPDGFSRHDFRDPKLFKTDGMYFCLIGSRGLHEGTVKQGGNLLLYRSANLLQWEFIGSLFDTPVTENGVLECPDYFTLSGREVLLCSPQNMKREGFQYQNSCSSAYSLGKLELHTGRWEPDAIEELDAGFDFYAPQTLLSPDGRRILIAWMNMWERSYPSKEDGWAGSMTLPRELTLKDGRIYQMPVREIETYRRNKIEYAAEELKKGETRGFEGIRGNKIELQVEAELEESACFGIKLFSDPGSTADRDKNETVFFYEASNHTVTFDRSRNGKRILIPDKENYCGEAVRKLELRDSGRRISLRIFLDKSSVEAFFNDGEHVMTSTVFPGESDTGIQFFSEHGKTVILKLVQYDIDIQK